MVAGIGFVSQTCKPMLTERPDSCASARTAKVPRFPTFDNELPGTFGPNSNWDTGAINDASQEGQSSLAGSDRELQSAPEMEQAYVECPDIVHELQDLVQELKRGALWAVDIDNDIKRIQRRWRWHRGKEVAFAAIRHNAHALERVAPGLKRGQKCKLEAASRKCNALKYAAPFRLRNEEFMLEAVRFSASALEHAPPELKRNGAFLLEAIARNCDALRHAAPFLLRDQAFVLEAVRQNASALKHASLELKCDKEFMLDALQLTASSMEYAGPELKCNPNFMLEALDAAPSLSSDPKFMLEAARCNGTSILGRAASSLLLDSKFILEALRQEGRLSPSRRQILSVVRPGSKVSVSALEHAAPSLLSDSEFMLEAVRHDATVLKYAAIELRHDRKFMSEAIRRNASALKHADQGLILDVVSWNAEAVRYSPLAFLHDSEFILEAVRRNSLVLDHINLTTFDRVPCKLRSEFLYRLLDILYYKEEVSERKIMDIMHTLGSLQTQCWLPLQPQVLCWLERRLFCVCCSVKELCLASAIVPQDCVLYAAKIALSNTDGPTSSSASDILLDWYHDRATLFRNDDLTQCCVLLVVGAAAVDRLEAVDQRVRQQAEKACCSAATDLRAAAAQSVKRSLNKITAAAVNVALRRAHKAVPEHMDESSRSYFEYVVKLLEKRSPRSNTPVREGLLGRLSATMLFGSQFSQRSAGTDTAGSTDGASTLRSAARNLPPLPVTDVNSASDFRTRVLSLVDDSIKDTCGHSVNLTFEAHGGSCFVTTTKQAYEHMASMNIDAQAVDKSEFWTDGYMTEVLREVHVAEPNFKTEVLELTKHTHNDRWDETHEAGGLPKDGFTALLTPKGFRKKCACRMLGLPQPPFSWDGVGTRHMAALSIACVLREYPSAVIVRSDSGKIHAFVWQGGELHVLCCERDA